MYPNFFEGNNMNTKLLGRWGEEKAAAYLKNKGYEEIEIKKDLAGLDRVVMGRYNKE